MQQQGEGEKIMNSSPQIFVQLNACRELLGLFFLLFLTPCREGIFFAFIKIDVTFKMQQTNS